MIAVALALGALAPAAAQDEATCDAPALTAPEASLSVAWVSPLLRRARGKAWLYVVPTTELRAFAQGEGRGDVARLLQWVGARRSSRPPHRRYKVVIFDVDAEALCRPVVSEEERPGGVASCDEARSGRHRRYEGCGWLTDLATGEPSVQTYRAQWNALAGNGFCLLPLERFVER